MYQGSKVGMFLQQQGCMTQGGGVLTPLLKPVPTPVGDGEGPESAATPTPVPMQHLF